ncbi:MAG: LPXTG cell wall anchor domain-containing protein [Ruminococcus sp.]|nr:LPXTG cell wall anchor domain-containing protein [Ruminococcus sp.]
MKLRKILSSVVAAAIAVSAMTFSASADAVTVLDFENGTFDGITMKTDDGGDKSILSVVDYNGSKQLKVEIQKANRIPKVFFDINTLVGANNMDKLVKVSFDLTIQSKLILDDSDPDNIVYEITSWQGGGCGAQDGEGGSLGWTELGAWTCEDYEDGSNSITINYDLGSARYTNGTEGSHLLFMKWAGTDANPVDMYIDNVKFMDADGNALEFYPAAAEEAPAEEETTEEEAPAEEEATEEEAPAEEEVEEEATEEVEEEATEEEVEEEVAEEEVEEEAAEEEVEEAPAAGDVAGETDSSKGSPDTGVEDVAVVAGLAIVAAGAVLVSKKRK